MSLNISSDQTIIRLGGVPEHFNMPWIYAIENNLFEKEGISVEWTDYPAGTGAMVKDLRSDILDGAVVLTEGMIADIINGNDCRIVKWHVTSPLVWGIHTGAGNELNDLSNIQGKKYAISRFGSGSHLMAFVDARQRNIEIQEEQFIVVNNLAGAEKSLSANETDLFMWEKFMTKPLVDKGVFKRIGECPTPWPSFLIAFKKDFLAQNKEAIRKLLHVINSVTRNFKNQPDIINSIAKKYSLQPIDVAAWLNAVEWSSDNNMKEEEIQKVVNTLYELNIIKEKKSFEELVVKI